eukprot:768204-Hanusia_phi.AAC.5
MALRSTEVLWNATLPRVMIAETRDSEARTLSLQPSKHSKKNCDVKDNRGISFSAAHECPMPTRLASRFLAQLTRMCEAITHALTPPSLLNHLGVEAQLPAQKQAALHSRCTFFAAPPTFQRRRFFESKHIKPTCPLVGMQMLGGSPLQYLSKLLHMSSLRGGGTAGETEEKEGEKKASSFARPRTPVLNPDVSKYEEELADKVDLGMWHVGDDIEYAFMDPETKKPIFLDQ